MFATLRRATARHLGLAEAPASPAAPSLAPSAPKPRLSPQSMRYARNDLQTIMFTLTPSPLTRDDLTPKQIDSMVAAFRSTSVQYAGAAVRFKLLKFVEEAALRSEMNRAIAGMDPNAVTPDAVAALLRQRADEIDDLIEVTKEDHARHDAATKARRDQLMPLRMAVSERLNKLRTELDSLAREAAALRAPSSSFANTEQTRLMLLKQAGVTDAELAAMRAVAAAAPVNHDERRAQVQARISEVKAAMQPLREFCEAGDESVLAGIAEFEPLIAARHAVEVRE